MNLIDEDKAHEQFSRKMLKNLSLQDAITIIGISAAQIDLDRCRYVDPASCRDNMTFIGKKERNIPIFDENPENTMERIHLFINFLQTVDPRIELEKASEVIKESNMSEAAFEFAVQVALHEDDLTLNKKIVLDEIASYLGLDIEITDRLINQHRWPSN